MGKLISVFLYQLLIGSLQVVWDVLTPTHLSDPKIIRIPLDVETDFQIMLLANLISLTPGTLILDVTDDKKFLIAHAMFAKDEAAIINDIKQTFERLIMELTRE
jgi:multicomponent Na+:H+ antiporter subunit E